MKTKTFERMEDLTAALVELLTQHLKLNLPAAHAILLPGGRTPLQAYRYITQNPCSVDRHACILLSDERHTPVGCPESNYGQLLPMLKALVIPDERILRVDTERPLESAAQQYDNELRLFFERKGRITLGVLGLGADGHTASLFSAQDVVRGRGSFALAVPRQPGPDRVSVTSDLLARIEYLVFIASGAEKRAIVKRMTSAPSELPAGLAAAGVPHSEIWFAV